MARILVIDDDRAVSAVALLLLKRSGHEALSADNGRQGLDLLARHDFDLLIIDIFMPEMDGFETIRLLRQTKPDLPVIVMSGAQSRVDRPDFLDMATKLGAIRSVRKPFTPRALMEAVGTSLTEAGRLRPLANRSA